MIRFKSNHRIVKLYCPIYFFLVFNQVNLLDWIGKFTTSSTFTVQAARWQCPAWGHEGGLDLPAGEASHWHWTGRQCAGKPILYLVCLVCFDTLQRSNFWQSLRTLMFDRRFHKNCASIPSADTHKNYKAQNPKTVLDIFFAWDLFLFYRHISSGDGECSDSVLWLF